METGGSRRSACGESASMASRCHRQTPTGMVEKLRQGSAYCAILYDWQGRSTIPIKPETAYSRIEEVISQASHKCSQWEEDGTRLGCFHTPVLIVLCIFRSWLAWLAALTQKVSKLPELFPKHWQCWIAQIVFCMYVIKLVVRVSHNHTDVPAGQTNRKHT